MMATMSTSTQASTDAVNVFPRCVCTTVFLLPRKSAMAVSMFDLYPSLPMQTWWRAR